MTRSAVPVDRADLLHRYRRNARARARCSICSPTTRTTAADRARHPIVFYEGHLPAFSFNTLVKKGARAAEHRRRLETLFARGIDPA